jgi:hypothetical protein
MVSSSADCTAAIASPLGNLETDNGIIKYFEEKEHTIKVVREGSAIVEITFRRKAIVRTNVYFFLGGWRAGR